jgi:hypothetical protein
MLRQEAAVPSRAAAASKFTFTAAGSAIAAVWESIKVAVSTSTPTLAVERIENISEADGRDDEDIKL